MTRKQSLWRWATGLIILSLVDTSPRNALAIGGQFGFEFAIDAPWRIEPLPAGRGYTYGPIAIVVTFHDAVFEAARSPISGALGFEKIGIGSLREIRVIELTRDQPHPVQAVTIVKPQQLREIERKRLVSTKTTEPPRELCRPTPSHSCTTQLRISDTHEWHAVFWYTPKAPVTPGRNIHLEVIAVTGPEGMPSIKREWRNFLVVHAGEAPLPRFGTDWLYGDLHYHSQMTDNEGESAYCYRNVARSLGTLGMDFVFATDHASNGVQVDGKIDRRFCADGQGHSCFEARDLNVNKYTAAKSVLYGPGGVNEAIVGDAQLANFARLRSANVVPQVYLGEEVDAWPEVSSREHADGVLYYGDGLKYAWPNSNNCIQKEGLEKCRTKYSRQLSPHDFRTYLLFDEQGIPTEETVDEKIQDDWLRSVVKVFTPDKTTPEPSRQHLVYFPTSSLPNAEGWISSDTGKFGGAGKRLQGVIQEVKAHGFAFLAHPLISSSPGGPGPDVVPYSDNELTVAWGSPAILGLQFWNENDHYYSAPDRRSPTVMFSGPVEGEQGTTRFSFNWPFQGHQYGNFPWSWRYPNDAIVRNQLYHGAFTWDRYLRKGVDLQQTAALGWLPRGEPRKWFMAGGSDAHGDLNFRRYGRPCMDRWCDVPVGDTAIGNPRNLVSMSRPATAPVIEPADRPPPASGPRRYGNQEVIAVLREGNFSVTDGPAIRIVVDRNRNGVIDEADFPMGSMFHFFPGEHIPLLVEWISTAEFGPVEQIDVYVGNSAVTFAPKDHGPGIPPGGGRPPQGSYDLDPSGVLQIRLVDAYGRYKDAAAGYHGVAKLFLGPAQFRLAASDQALSYVRTVARTLSSQQASDRGLCAKGGTAGSKCGSRYGYSNPIWAKYFVTCPQGRRPPRFIRPPFLDSDANAIPDACERDLPDPCPPSRGRFDPGRLGRAVGPLVGQPPPGGGPAPAKPVPSNSCQFVSATP